MKYSLDILVRRLSR